MDATMKKMQMVMIPLQLLDYPCTRVVTVVNAGAIKKRSCAPGGGRRQGAPLPPRIEQSSPRKSKMLGVRGKG